MGRKRVKFGGILPEAVKKRDERLKMAEEMQEGSKKKKRKK